ncbi:MAG: TonB-dependent receptor [Candidatus Marinimicrobia bacterium]|nr:TonB-dependent receptor [Candidatus Neomarinimicrobiota bacterium]
MILEFKKSVVFLSLISMLFAGDISFSGRIFDKSSQEPIKDANIIILNTDEGAVSDDDGYFYIELEIEEKFKYRVEHIGYQNYQETINLKNQKEIHKNIYLSKSAEKFSPVIVTARGYATEARNISGSIGIVNQKEIYNSSPLGISDVAESIPGINKSSDMPWGSDLNIRGLSNDKIVVLVDGNRISTATAIPARFGTIAPQDIERVEILKGPLSVQYGSGSIGGVANIITKKGEFEQSGWDIEINNSFESVAKGKSSYGRMNYNSENIYFSLSQSYRDYNNYAAGKNIEIPNSQFTDYQTSLNLGYRINNQNSIKFQGQYMEAQNVGIPGGGGQFPPPAKAVYPSTSRSLFELNWNYEPKSKVWQKSSLKAYYQPIHRAVDLEPNTVKTDTIKNGKAVKYIQPQLFQPRADHYVMGTKWQNYFKINNHRITAGMEIWQREYNGKRTKNINVDVLNSKGDTLQSMQVTQVDKPLPDAKYRPLGFFAEDEYKLNQKTTLNFGARVDQIHIQNEKSYMTIKPSSDSIRWEASEDTDYSFSLQSGLVHSLNSQLDLNFLVARSFRSPSLEERYQYIDLGSIVKLGDPQLDSESSWFFESGINYTTPNINWSANTFLNLTRNLVIEKTGTYEGKSALIKTNAGKARLYGFDTRVNWLVTNNFQLTGSLAYTRGYDTEKEQSLPSIPPLHLNFSGHYNFGDHVWGEILFKGTARQNNVAPGESETPGYGIINIKTGINNIDFLTVNNNFTIGIKNLFDKKYKRHLTRSRGFELYEPGRSYFVNWNINL